MMRTVPSLLELLRKVLTDAGHADLAFADELGAWGQATERLVTRAAGHPRSLPILARAWAFCAQAGELAARPRESWAAHLAASDCTHHMGLESLSHVLAEAADAQDGVVRGALRELRLSWLASLSDGALRDRTIADTDSAIAILDALRDDPPTPFGERIRRLFPDLSALAVEAEPHASVEHERGPAGARARPLLDHLVDRVLRRKLLGLERADRAVFQRDEALSGAAFEDEVRRFRRLEQLNLVPCLRASLMYLDFAKGGDPAQRERWKARHGADLSVHNLAARRILDAEGILGTYTYFRTARPILGLALALVESHGLAGQAVRGETPLVLFASWVRAMRQSGAALGTALGVSEGEALAAAFDCLHFVNLCDTAGVREGLVGDALLEEMRAVEKRIETVMHRSTETALEPIEAELAILDDPFPGGERVHLTDRLARLRRSRIDAGEPRAHVAHAVAALPEEAASRLVQLFRSCQLWYAEAATAGLSPEAQLKVLAIGMRAAEASPGVSTNRPFHLSLLPLVPKLRGGADRSVPYRLRLIETMLAPLSARAILDGDLTLRSGSSPLGTFETEIGGTAAVGLSFEESEEAEALLTLLPIYETKSSAAFHATLKALCDLYGLRKDEFDRVANEAMYLASMNAAKNDKARMLEHVKPGRIVEVGPGGGVVLDLLEQRFPGSQVIGIDASRMVVDQLQERQRREKRQWKIVHADAFQLPQVVGEAKIDSVIFCSVLHEVYSYVEYASDAGGTTSRFRLEAVRDLLRAAYRTLQHGGRIVIRDGITPPPGERILRFIAPDAREFFELFARQFEGRPIQFEQLADDKVKLSAADATSWCAAP
jgi:SAM-dependent methyltransferase